MAFAGRECRIFGALGDGPPAVFSELMFFEHEQEDGVVTQE
jgi:hypothetical protein